VSSGEQQKHCKHLMGEMITLIIVS